MNVDDLCEPIKSTMYFAMSYSNRNRHDKLTTVDETEPGPRTVLCRGAVVVLRRLEMGVVKLESDAPLALSRMSHLTATSLIDCIKSCLSLMWLSYRLKHFLHMKWIFSSILAACLSSNLTSFNSRSFKSVAIPLPRITLLFFGFCTMAT